MHSIEAVSLPLHQYTHTRVAFSTFLWVTGLHRQFSGCGKRGRPNILSHIPRIPLGFACVPGEDWSVFILPSVSLNPTALHQEGREKENRLENLTYILFTASHLWKLQTSRRTHLHTSSHMNTPRSSETVWEHYDKDDFILLARVRSSYWCEHTFDLYASVSVRILVAAVYFHSLHQLLLMNFFLQIDIDIPCITYVLSHIRIMLFNLCILYDVIYTDQPQQ